MKDATCHVQETKPKTPEDRRCCCPCSICWGPRCLWHHGWHHGVAVTLIRLPEAKESILFDKCQVLERARRINFFSFLRELITWCLKCVERIVEETSGEEETRPSKPSKRKRNNVELENAPSSIKYVHQPFLCAECVWGTRLLTHLISFDLHETGWHYQLHFVNEEADFQRDEMIYLWSPWGGHNQKPR